MTRPDCPSFHQRLEHAIGWLAVELDIGPGLPPTSSGNHRPDGNQAGHALTFKLDHSTGADHKSTSRFTLTPPPWVMNMQKVMTE